MLTGGLCRVRRRHGEFRPGGAIRSGQAITDYNWADSGFGGEVGDIRRADECSQTAGFLTLAIAQLQTSLQHGDSSVATLSEAFTVFVNGLRAIVVECPGGSLQGTTIQDICDDLSGKVTAVVIAFQFYDRPTQDLTHISANHSTLAALITDASPCSEPAEWTAFLAEVRSRYTMESEHRIADRLLEGAPLGVALFLAQQAAVADGRSGEVDFF